MKNTKFRTYGMVNCHIQNGNLARSQECQTKSHHRIVESMYFQLEANLSGK